MNEANRQTLLVAKALLSTIENGVKGQAVEPEGLDADVVSAIIRDIAPAVGIRMDTQGNLSITTPTKGQLKLMISRLEAEATPQDVPQETGERDSRDVFVVHGRNLAARDAVFDILRSLRLTPIEWETARALTGAPNPYVGQILDAAFSRASAIVVLITGDDLAHVRADFSLVHDGPEERSPRPQARPNVLFECGLALGRYPNRTVIVQVGAVRPFTDLGGVHLLRLADTPEARRAFASRLRDARCPADTDSSEYLTAGDLASAWLAADN